jgi:hypothetical protein
MIPGAERFGIPDADLATGAAGFGESFGSRRLAVAKRKHVA